VHAFTSRRHPHLEEASGRHRPSPSGTARVQLDQLGLLAVQEPARQRTRETGYQPAYGRASYVIVSIRFEDEKEDPRAYRNGFSKL
jgi:hypothetical protein